MANIQTGSIVADIRGSVATETYSRNQGGLYVKSRTGPSGEPTAKQLAVTDAMTLLSQAWSGTLTDQQRQDWRSYASQHPQPNCWGVRSLTNGYTRFISVNFPYARIYDQVYTASPPTAPPLGPPHFTPLVDVSLAMIIIPVPVMPQIPADQTYNCYVYEGTVVPPGVNYYSSPFSYLNILLRTYATWVASPPGATTALPLVAGQKLYVRIRIQNRVTFAISPPAISSAIIVP